MNFGLRRLPVGREAEVAALIATLHASEQRLEQLTGGEVDTVADITGRTLLLQNAQSQLRTSVAEQQAAILNALPAQVALLDPQGFVLAVNDAWSRFGGGYPHSISAGGLGVNYADACESAAGEDSKDAGAAAAGIRRVLAGELPTFSIDFSCPAPDEVSCLRMTVTPMSEGRLSGAVVMNVDITRERRAQGILRESERRFSGLMGSIQMASVMLDTQGRITYCNEYLLRLTGWRLDEVLGRDWFETFMPSELGDMRPAFAQLLQDLPETWHRENAIRTRSGERRLVRWHNSVLRSGDGKVTGTASIGEDITEQRRNEESLRQNTERSRSIVDAALDAVVVMDATGRIIDWNSQAERTFGWPREEALGRLVAETIIPVAYREEHARGLRRFLETGVGSIVGKPVEISAVHRDGHRIPVELSITPVKLAGEWIFSSFIRDLTQRKRGEQELRRFASAIDATSDAIYMVDRETMSYVHVNDAACRMQGLSREKLMERGPGNLLSMSRTELTQTYDDIIESEGVAPPLETPWVRKDGTPTWLEVRRHAQSSGGRWTMVAIIRDIAERKEAENRIRRLNRLYAVLSGINSLIVRVADRAELFREACRVCVEAGAFKTAWIGEYDLRTREGTIVACNGEGSLLTDAAWLTSCDEASAREQPACRALRESTVVICNDIETDPSLAMVRDDLRRRECRSLAFFPLGASGQCGRVLALFASEAGVFDEEETRLLVELAGDITHALDHIEKKELLDYLAYYDALTGLANRKLFLERLAQYLQSAAVEGHKLALFLIDLERFKNINDSFGRIAGDALLKQVADWLNSTVGVPNQLARIGADEFALVMPEVKQEGDTARFLETTLEAFRRHPFRMGEAELRLAVKVGIAVFPEDGDDAELLCDRAEAALKKAKASGERYLFHTQTMTEMVAGRVTLENQLRHALEKDEFVLHYQPKVSSASSELTGVEALIRWNDPRTGLVPPFSFIPLLEETGMIHEVGRWAMRKAIEDYLRWRAAGLDPPRVAVNVSPLQLRHRGFVREIAEAIGVDPHAAQGLELEITESLIMEDVQHSIATLEAIRAMGVRVAIDDFGTGYSSLSYLAKLPVDTIKIDRSFVIEMTTGEQGLALVSTIVALGHSLKLTIVAEGVENEEQAACLRRLGCDELQGYLFSRPVPGATFEEKFLAARQEPGPP
jgi:diguanylate cyclase (GGDEF)-like protein/PAS domain S-box-containing protein